MAATNPAYRDVVDAWTSDVESYKRALVYYEHQRSVEDVIEHVQQLAHAGGYYDSTDPTESILLSVCIGQQNDIRDLEDRVDELEAALDDGD
ncbi:hypothetical protein [Haloarchaeobius sp. HRN-SO-5]|uniref:hypothetical protein n=1 Tax=Haloarchaeobius sp. HRN-SO-5 TaxID=3446118 RepID=UPI003EBD04AB